MNEIGLTVIADDTCATSRAYLTYLANAGFRPHKALVVSFLGRSRKARLIALAAGRRTAAAVLRTRSRFRTGGARKRQLYEMVQGGLPFKIDYAEAFDYGRHATEVEHLVADDFADPRLQARLTSEDCRTFLYTAGGLVPASLLSRRDMRFIHVHPGVVPHVRGSDGLLWSLATRGVPGASCFYMNTGIDTGEIIATKEFPRPMLSLDLSERASFDVLYEALLHAYDPHLRAQLLADVVANAGGSDLHRLPAKIQPKDGGRVFFSMHEVLRNQVLSSLTDAAQTFDSTPPLARGKG